jgi:hypothetical protein
LRFCIRPLNGTFAFLAIMHGPEEWLKDMAAAGYLDYVLRQSFDRTWDGRYLMNSP